MEVQATYCVSKSITQSTIAQATYEALLQYMLYKLSANDLVETLTAADRRLELLLRSALLGETATSMLLRHDPATFSSLRRVYRWSARCHQATKHLSAKERKDNLFGSKHTTTM